MILVISFLIGADIYWHIWEYKERKRLDKCWEDLFNRKIESDNRYIELIKKICNIKDE